MLDRETVCVVCPYYKWDKGKVIRCEGHNAVDGAVDGAVESRVICFGSVKAKTAYGRSVCSTYDYASKCHYAAFLHDLYFYEK